MKSSRTPLVLAAYATIVILASLSISSAGSAPLVGRETKVARSARARFVDVTADVGLPTKALPNWGSVFFDYNGDGRPDLFINRHTTRADLYVNHGTFFFRHQTTAFQEKPSGLRAYDRHGCAWGEANHDGRPDLYCVSGAQRGQGRGPNQLLINTGVDFVDRSIGGDSLSLADFNRDGRVDVLVTNSLKKIRAPIALLQNETPAGHWLELELNAGRRNPFGFGTKVQIKTSSRILWREVTDGVGFRGQSEGALHVGLGSARRARIRVFWPRGGRDCVSVRADGLVNLRRGAHRCKS